jgi:hypothetical protein
LGALTPRQFSWCCRDALRAKQQAKTEAKLEISRERILQELAAMALAPATLSGSMTKLKAIELLAKLQGYNEPERQQLQHLHLHVNESVMAHLRAGHDALLARASKKQVLLPTTKEAPPSIEEIRSGYAQLAERNAKAC